jgi:predicted dehydrogenase
VKAKVERARPVGLGIVGLGFMGLTHLRASQSLRGGRLRAIVTTDPAKARGDFRSVRGNFGSGGGKIDLAGIRVYPGIDDMLRDETVTLVDICLPSHLHAPIAMRCLRAGKHVLVEKPVALRPADAQKMIGAARRSGRLLMVAQVLKFFPEFAHIADATRDRRYGQLLAVHFRRRIAKPDWGGGSWFADPKKSGGMVVDLHIHDTDFVVHLFGKPRAVTSQGLVRGGSVDFIRTCYHYSRNAPLVTSEAGWVNAQSLPFLHGYDAYFEQATIHYDAHRAPEPTVYAGKKPQPLKLPAGDAFATELQAAVDAVRAGKIPDVLSAQSAATSLEVVRAEEASARTGKMVTLARPSR